MTCLTPLNLKTCLRCGKKFDIAINFNICPECRIKIKKEWCDKWKIK